MEIWAVCVHEREVNSSQFTRLKIELPFSPDYDKIVGYPRETGGQGGMQSGHKCFHSQASSKSPVPL